MRQSIYSYVWVIPGWYTDRWWETGGDVILGDRRCNSTELAMFIVHQRVIAISHHPNILNLTLSEDGVCVSFLLPLPDFRDKTRKLCLSYHCYYNVLPYFLIIRHILLISSYSLLSTCYFAVLFTRCQVHFAYKRMWPLISISACFLASPGFQPNFKLVEIAMGTVESQVFFKQC